jgi:hypothetical protein
MVEMPGGTIAVTLGQAGFGLEQGLKRDRRAASHDVLDLGTDPAAMSEHLDIGQTLAEAIVGSSPGRIAKQSKGFLS